MPRFVILEHLWRGVHYDLMLEDEAAGCLRTWAVDPPFGFGPTADREARRLPDHRLAYLDYEGPISGDRGVVKRIARGDYEPASWDEDRIGAVLVGDGASGRLLLTLSRPIVGNSAETRPGTAWLLRLGNVI